ncbi:hypothetical protein SAMN02949497_0434 [Methylomagnum ishizawai]|uniref:Uncharacterized protein n=1 Tax=Methylomagnum ishizawai TaxID=1760988 RepID=A0A1Y6D418_9GAMM|nr:hypothetical protein [Methylomagnum ishizawai]SMF97407.1 hypothetical protein SAMN02949497_0434 [Methylomagnum ishizawai]
MTETDSIRAALAAHPFPPNPWVQVTDEGIIIKAGYTDTLHRMLRWVPKVRWIPERRHWHVPLAGAELIRSVLPEISRLAEATYEEPPAAADPPQPPATTPVPVDAALSERDLFRNSARFLFGTDWQRDTARALGRDEAALACWLAGDGTLEDDPGILLDEMLGLMHRRAAAIVAAAGRLSQAIEERKADGR